MHFITLLFFFPFLQTDSVPVEPFDSTGISYRESMEDLMPFNSISFPGNEQFTESGTYSDGMKKNKVKKISSEGVTWEFDSNGNLVEYCDLNRYHRFKYGKYSNKINYKYDDQNYLTQMDYYDLSIFISRGTYVSKTNERLTYDYSADHRVCKKYGEQLNYSNVASRTVGFEPRVEYAGTDSFDVNGHLANHKGTWFNHKTIVDYSYNGNDLTKRKVLFTDCNAGYVDSIAYSFSGTNKIQKHYFSVCIPSKPMNYVLLETLTLNAANKITEIIVDPNAQFPVDEFDDFYRVRYSAIYKGDSLMEESEFDSLRRCCNKKIYSYGVAGNNHFTHCITMIPADTVGGIDTLFVTDTYYNSSGLFQKRTTLDFVDYFENDIYHPLFYDKPLTRYYSVKYTYFRK